jgi:tetratricopeptide (TPR) repeat protein
MFEAIGAEKPSTLTSMNNLVLVLRGQGKYERAEEMYRQALEPLETLLGKEHPSTLANVVSREGEYEQAEEIQSPSKVRAPLQFLILT